MQKSPPDALRPAGQGKTGARVSAAKAGTGERRENRRGMPRARIADGAGTGECRKSHGRKAPRAARRE